MENRIDKNYSICGGLHNMKSLKYKFGKRVRELRKSRGLTQEQIAELINIEPPNVSKMENGMHFPQPDKIEKIAKALNVEIYDLFDFEHHNDRIELLNKISIFLKEADLNDIELVYKFINNLKLYK